MKKVHWEIVASMIFVLGGTFLLYGQLANNTAFWDAQFVWSMALIVCWTMVAAGYYYQGWMIHKGHTTVNVSFVLPSIVFIVQCILFVKGVFFHDWSLIFGSLIVNSGVLFCLYQIVKTKTNWDPLYRRYRK